MRSRLAFLSCPRLHRPGACLLVSSWGVGPGTVSRTESCVESCMFAPVDLPVSTTSDACARAIVSRRTNESALVPEGDASSRQVVGRDFESYAIAGENSNAESPHLSRDRGVHVVTVVHLHAELRIRQHFSDRSFQLDCFFFCHNPPNVFCSGTK